MNRAQRRANNIQQDSWTLAQVKAVVKEDRKQVLHKLANDYSAVVTLCLRDKLGFGRKRASRFIASISELFEDIQHDRLSVDDIKKTVKEEIGIIID